MDIPRRYPLHEFPFAHTAEEEAYYRRVHYLASSLWAFDAGDDVLSALGLVWEQVMTEASVRASAGVPAASALVKRGQAGTDGRTRHDETDSPERCGVGAHAEDAH